MRYEEAVEAAQQLPDASLAQHYEPGVQGDLVDEALLGVRSRRPAPCASSGRRLGALLRLLLQRHAERGIDVTRGSWTQPASSAAESYSFDNRAGPLPRM